MTIPTALDDDASEPGVGRPSWRRRLVRVVAVGALLVAIVTVVPPPAAALPTAPAWTDPTLANLVRNGSFESGSSPWNFRHDVAATLAIVAGDAVDGARFARVHVAATSPSTWFVQLRQEHLHLQGGNTYTLSFWARASSERVINARLQSPIAPYRTFSARDVTVTGDWQQFQLAYTSPVDVADAFAGFNLAQTAGDVDIDQVALTTANLVADGGFETPASFAPWSFRNDIGATLTRDTTTRFDGTASARMAVPTVGAASHLVQLRQLVGPQWTRATYRVGFAIKASRTRPVNVRLQSSDAPYPTAIERTFTATTAWTQVSFDWAPTSTVSNPFLGFNLAQATGTVWLDDVVFVQTGGPTAACVAGFPDHATAFTSLAPSSRTVHAGEEVGVTYELRDSGRPVVHTDWAYLFYKGPDGRISRLDLDLNAREEATSITVPLTVPVWAPGRYQLVQVDNLNLENPYVLEWGSQYRNHDDVGQGMSGTTVCGRSDLDLSLMDLEVVAP